MVGSVLLVENDPSVRGFLRLILTDEGYDVRTAEDGREALALLDGWKPQLILLDLKMPVMDGHEFRRRLLADAELARIPIVILSGAAGLEREARSLEPAGVLRKPCDIDLLLDTVAGLIGQGPSR